MKSPFIYLSFIILLTANNFAGAQENASVKRVGLFIGSNNGGPGRAVLRWAETDARAVSQVFGEMGGIAPADNIILSNPGVRQINDRLDRASKSILAAKSEVKRTELVVYYSGHSDEDGLLLGRESYDYKTLRGKIDAVPADMRIVILDSCWSGAFTRAKGGQKTQSFLLDEQTAARGHAFLTSSSADELSQESDTIRGSFFTHSLLAGLRGSASSSGNGRVTLNEAYRYAYDETLRKTESALYGRQHPSYDIQVSGTGDVVLTDVRAASAGLVLGEDLNGRLSIRDSDGFLIAELTKASGKKLELGLAPGSYSLLLRQQIGVYSADVTLADGKHGLIEMKDFKRISLEEAIARGGINADGTPSEIDSSEPDAYTGEIVEEPVRVELIAGFGRRADEPKTRNNLLIGILTAEGYDLEGFGLGMGLRNVHDVTGMHFAGVYSAVGGSFTGLQMAGILSWNTGAFNGAQMSGIFNVQGNENKNDFPLFLLPGNVDMRGLQMAGIFNWAGRLNQGAQFAGIFNWSNYVENGAQFAGFLNWNGTDMAGAAQFAGLINWSGGSVHGAQISGILNYAGGGINGAQIGIVNAAWGESQAGQIGLFNVMGKGRGGQIGLVNIAHNENAKAVGLVNFVKNGLFNPAVYYGDLGLLNLSLKSGNRKLYSLLRFGGKAPPADSFDLAKNNEHAWSLGIGTELRFKKLFFDFDLSSGTLYSANFYNKLKSAIDDELSHEDAQDKLESEHTQFVQLRFSTGFSVFEHLSVFGGASYTFAFTRNGSPSPQGLFRDAGPFRHGVSFFGGLQF